MLRCIRFAACLCCIAVLGSTAKAESVFMYKETGATLINGLALTSDRYTGWVNVAKFQKIVFAVTFVDADDSVTRVQWTCQESNSSSTTAGSGFDICSTVTGAGTTDYYCPWTGQTLTDTADKFKFTVTNMGSDYVQCKFHATGTAGAADLITVVTEKVISP